MRMSLLSKEMQAFIGVCEHLLSTHSPLLSDDERYLIDYYMQEFSNTYGAPKEDGAGSAKALKEHGAKLVPKHHDTGQPG